MVYKLNRIGIMKTAFFMGLYGFALGLIFGIVIAIVTAMLPSSSGALGLTESLVNLGWLAILVLPFLFGIMNFLAVFIFVPIINLILKLIKGVEFDLIEEEDPIPQNSSIRPVQKPVSKPINQVKNLSKKPM